MKAKFHRQALIELSEAAEYYESESDGLGGEFLGEIRKAISHIKEHPYGSPVVDHEIRQKLVSRFPFALVYVAEPKRLYILAVAHQRRRPFYWRDRRVHRDR